MALNNVDLQGRLCKDVELLNTNNGGTYLRNTLAVQRNYVKQGEERQTDFISIIAYGKTAEHISKYYQKGSQILINGEIRTGSYDKDDGIRVYTTDVIVNRTYFCENKKDNTNNLASSTPSGFEKKMQEMGVNTSNMNDMQFEATMSNIPSIPADNSDLPF